jgi:hypothetical protein
MDYIYFLISDRIGAVFFSFGGDAVRRCLLALGGDGVRQKHR